MAGWVCEFRNMKAEVVINAAPITAMVTMAAIFHAFIFYSLFSAYPKRQLRDMLVR